MWQGNHREEEGDDTRLRPGRQPGLIGQKGPGHGPESLRSVSA